MIVRYSTWSHGLLQCGTALSGRKMTFHFATAPGKCRQTRRRKELCRFFVFVFERTRAWLSGSLLGSGDLGRIALLEGTKVERPIEGLKSSLFLEIKIGSDVTPPQPPPPHLMMTPHHIVTVRYGYRSQYAFLD